MHGEHHGEHYAEHCSEHRGEQSIFKIEGDRNLEAVVRGASDVEYVMLYMLHEHHGEHHGKQSEELSW